MYIYQESTEHVERVDGLQEMRDDSKGPSVESINWSFLFVRQSKFKFCSPVFGTMSLINYMNRSSPDIHVCDT